MADWSWIDRAPPPLQCASVFSLEPLGTKHPWPGLEERPDGGGDAVGAIRACGLAADRSLRARMTVDDGPSSHVVLE